jgi:hypothetical protein
MKETLKVINQMQQDGIIGQYAIGGAVGATLYVNPASTVDIDIFITIPPLGSSRLISLSPVYDYLTGLGFKSEHEHLLIHDWPVQFLPAANTLEQEAIEKADMVQFAGLETRVMKPEHLVAIALKTGRPKDALRILQFLEKKAINPAKLKAVLSRHGLEIKWQAFQKKHVAK